jgi:hypothetical protein
MHFLLTSSGRASGSKNLPLNGVAFSEVGHPSTRLPAAPPFPVPSFEDLNLVPRLPKQQMMEQKKLDRFLETEKNGKV